ncbi:HpcH/HpaI aldolase/citrate lyase family protein [Caballeronia concitans]|uniref:Citrate lyase subunit beta n=1 Tax=Caballeronia concitans TaxID=1777133 RepID=A0A658QTT1_9BURK|nr:CoA ester lyase [Caballeronia concitans]KIG01901.1 Citryl-CoA lyase [Burkholderia sp. MR1]SAL20819.1 citrate lyase subunit beta [Caballeronia concitans]
MIRSLLFVPASAERFVAKAHQRGADAIILDLEDAIPPDGKQTARAALVHAVPRVGRGGAAVLVRINSEPELRDLDAVAACRAGAAALLVPKVTTPATLAALADILGPVERSLGREPLRFMPLVEDPGAVLDARAIAAGPRVFAIATGGEDLATEMDAEPTADMLRLPKLLVHLAAKAAGIRSFGMLRSVANYTDTEAIVASAREARSLGFDGASCIHPAVVPILNDAFSPSPAAVERAHRMVAAFDEAASEGRGAFTFDGDMVDLPIVARARRLIARAGSRPGELD